MRRHLLTLLLLMATSFAANSQSKIVEDFVPTCDSLAVLLKGRTGVTVDLKLKSVMKRGSTLDFYFTESLGDYPWYKGDEKWFRKELKRLYPTQYSKFKLGEIYSRQVPLDKLRTPHLTFDGNYNETAFTTHMKSSESPLVRKMGAMDFDKGLSRRHIALWQSHGKYYEKDKWLWQRPCLYQTCEDMFTQGFVLPYLVPMLENAGAYVLLPRERDTQRHEIIADNNPTLGGRGQATYQETGEWKDAGSGFADLKPTYEGVENPFTTGTARQAGCVDESTAASATALWTPTIPERGEYAVYVSYKSLPNSTTAAHYTVSHLGGTSEFLVNQKMGGGTWIYLGTFEFEEGTQGYVMLDNVASEGKASKSVVTADAVKIGGGMGNILRNRLLESNDSTKTYTTAKLSGMPRYAEAARYWLQWAGVDSTVFHQNEGQNDYKDDFMCRGDWVDWISRGSHMNPCKDGGMGIPIDLSFGLHSDAGVSPNDSTVGTLAIYTYKSDRKTKYPSGEDRMTSRMYADMVQSQVVKDIRASYDSLWSRRCIWDRSYRESRTPPCPAMLLELLSHQNFADMKYGLDPAFRFDVSRSIYKGILKYLCNRYGTRYVVQPLPVEDMGVRFTDGNKAIISWKDTKDPLEPTAVADGFILYTRCADGGWGQGKVLESTNRKDGYFEAEADIVPGLVMSFKVVAFNDGGMSFPSETVSIGLPAVGNKQKKVLIVNNFDRVSGPAFFDTPTYAGFDNSLDSGVADRKDITFVGEMYNFRRGNEWITNDRPGFGASYSDMAGEIVAGNTFDYASVHGMAILSAGYPFYSCSNERFSSDPLFRSGAWAVDLVCGKQVSVNSGKKVKYTVFTPELQKSIRDFTSLGGNMLVSGAYIGTDIWDEVYPVKKDEEERKASQSFAKEVLGYDFITNQASNKGIVISGTEPTEMSVKLEFWNTPNKMSYCVESPDGIAPASEKAKTIYIYSPNEISAGVAYESEGYRCISLGFPIETLKSKDDIVKVISDSLQYFEK